MATKVMLRVPATSANCGAGFDTLGLACCYYNEFTFELLPATQLKLTVEGEGADNLKPELDNLAFKAFYRVWDSLSRPATGLFIHMHNIIPLSRGLGSSSTAIVAGVLAANALAGEPYTLEELLAIATELEGHPDNVAPALYGGFTISYQEAQGVHTLKLKPALPLQLVLVIPELPLATELARSVVPHEVTRSAAIFNISRAALLVGALTTGQYEFLHDALQDQLHQPYRCPLIPGAEAAFEAARAAGAYNAVISGAGSTLLALVPAAAEADAVGKAMVAALAQAQLAATYKILELDTEGAKILKLC